MTAQLETGYGYDLKSTCVVVRSVTSKRDIRAIVAKAEELGAILGDSYAVSFLMFPRDKTDPKDPGSPKWRSERELKEIVARACRLPTA